MNRRNFISLLAGAAGAGVVLWRLPERRIFLPSRALVTAESGWVSRPESVTVTAHHPLCNCPEHVTPLTPEDIDACLEAIWNVPGPRMRLFGVLAEPFEYEALAAKMSPS